MPLQHPVAHALEYEPAASCFPPGLLRRTDFNSPRVEIAAKSLDGACQSIDPIPVPLEQRGADPGLLVRELLRERGLALRSLCRVLLSSAPKYGLCLPQCGGRGVFLLVPEIERRLSAESEFSHH